MCSVTNHQWTFHSNSKKNDICKQKLAPIRSLSIALSATLMGMVRWTLQKCGHAPHIHPPSYRSEWLVRTENPFVFTIHAHNFTSQHQLRMASRRCHQGFLLNSHWLFYHSELSRCYSASYLLMSLCCSIKFTALSVHVYIPLQIGFRQSYCLSFFIAHKHWLLTAIFLCDDGFHYLIGFL